MVFQNLGHVLEHGREWRYMRLITRHVSTALFCLLISAPSLVLANDDEGNSSINSLEEILLGGARQWILIRGEDTANPILLFLHGGPGHPEMPYSHVDSKRLEEHFVVVNWDQRGAGKSHDPAKVPESMTLEQHLADTHELIQLLRTRFTKDKIFLIGHSWGSVLGLYTAYSYPDYLYAYVGMGQVVNMMDGEMISYRYTLEKAEEAGDTAAVEMLRGIGPPPYANGFRSLSVQRMLLAKYGGSVHNITLADLAAIRDNSPFYTDVDRSRFMAAFVQTCTLLWDECMGVDFFTDVPEVQVPVYFFTGRCDYQAPFELLERYYHELKAPVKQIVWFENSCHMPNLDEPELYQERLIDILLQDTAGD